MGNEYARKTVAGRTDYVHRMVWESAHGPIPEGYELHHRNGDKRDNRLENLELLTPAEHAARHRRQALARRPSRFLSRVAKSEGGCWLWTGTRHSEGYGLTGTKPQEYAHRYAYQLFLGQIPERGRVTQTCGNRLCVNPAHLLLELGTRQSTRRSHCKWGHALTTENVYVRPDTGARQCRTCRDMRSAGLRPS